MKPTPLDRLKPYLAALGATTVAFAISLVFRDFFSGSPFLLFWGAVAFAAFAGGMGPALLSVVLTVVLVNFFISNPGDSLTIDGLEAVRFLLFAGVAGLISLMHLRRRTAEASASAARQQLEAILGGITDGITAQKPDGSLLYANEGAASMTGFTSAQSLLEAPVADVIARFDLLDEQGHPLSPTSLPGRRALRGERGAEALVRFRVLSSGEERWSQVKSTPVFDQRGNVAMAINLFHDVTPLKLAQKATDDQREWFRVTLAAIGDAVIATDLKGRVIFMNPVAETLTGWTTAEASQRPIAEVFNIVNEYSRRPVENPVERVLAEGVVVGLANHTLLIARDGSERAIDDSGAPIWDASQQLIGVVLVFRDVTQQRAMDERLRQTNQQLQTIIDAAPVAIVLFDRAGLVQMWSPGAQRIFGWTAEECIGKAPLTLPAERQHEFQETLAAMTRGDTVVNQIAHRQRKDGSAVIISFSAAALHDADDQTTGFITIAQDITAHMQAEETIRASHERMVEVLESISEGFYTLDRDWRFTYVNRQAELAWKMRREDLLGETMWEIFPNRAGTPGFEALKTAMDENHIVEDEIFSSFLNQWISLRVYPNRNGIAVYFRDISERKRADIAERFLDQAGSLLGSSLDYETTLANVARLATPEIADWCAVDILTENEDVKRVAVAHVDPAKVKWAYELQERYPVDLDAPTGMPNVLRTGKTEHYPLITEEMIRAASPDEEQLKIIDEIGFRSVLIVPLTARGRTFGAMSFVTTSDSNRLLTEYDRRVAEELARRAALAVDNARLYRDAQVQRRQFQVTLTSIGDAVIATDAHGQVTFMNSVAEALTGWPLADALERSLDSVFRIVNEETRQTVESPVTKVLREGQIVGLANHTVLIARDGTEVPIDDSGAPIRDESEAITGVVLVFRDITERKQVEDARATLLLQEQEARRAAEEANDLKLKFLAMISHELRTPLTSIKGFTSTLLAEDVSWDTSMQQEFVTIMDDEADKLVDLVEQLLDVSRLQAGTLRITPKLQPLTNAVDTAMAQLSAISAEHRLMLDIPGDLPPVEIDSQRIGQVLTNLVGNATKFSPPDSLITIVARRDGNHLRVDIHDDGEGIPPDESDLIFEAFRQVGRKTGAQKGAGLGLAICKGLVEAHGGDIWVSDSEPGGTTISFTLPVTQD